MAAVTTPVLESPIVYRPTTVSVVIWADSLDQWDDIDRAIESLHRQTERPDQIVLVVDHHDQLLEWAADVWSTPAGSGRPAVEVIASTGPAGAAGARDTGIAWSHGDVIAFLEHGALVADRHWVETLLEGYGDSHVAGVGGGVTADWEDADGPHWLPEESGWAFGFSHSGLPADRGDVDSLLGANMSFRREVFVELGGFGAAAESPDGICVRIRRRYPLARLLHDPDLEVFHRKTDDECSFAE